MEQQIKSLDLNKTIGVVTLSDGMTKLDIPKLSMGKIIKVVKFLGVDGAKLYGEYKEILLDDKIDDIEKVSVIFESLPEEKLIHIFSIALELRDEDVLALDQNEMLEIMIEYVDKTDLKKTFTLVRQLMEKMFNKKLPDIKEKFKEISEKARMERAKQKETQEVGKKSSAS